MREARVFPVAELDAALAGRRLGRIDRRPLLGAARPIIVRSFGGTNPNFA